MNVILNDHAPRALPDLFETFNRFGKNVEFSSTLEKTWPMVERMEPETRDQIVRGLAANIIYRTFHAMENNDQTRLAQFSRSLRIIKKSVTGENMLDSFIFYLAEFFKKRDYEVVSKTIEMRT
jgi:hypothetical protein